MSPRPLRTFALLAGLLLLGAAPLSAQLLTGIVREEGSRRPVAGVRVSASDTTGAILGEVESDSAGRFGLRVRAAGPIRVIVRKIGLQPSISDFFTVKGDATQELDLLVPASPVALGEVRVEARRTPTMNAVALEDARRAGWRVYAPEEVARHRDRARDFNDLMRNVGAAGVLVPNNWSQCPRLVRTNRCLTYVVDGQVLPGTPPLIPQDVYFFAIVGPAEANIRWGARVPWGAIVVQTRMNGDRYEP